MPPRLPGPAHKPLTRPLGLHLNWPVAPVPGGGELVEAAPNVLEVIEYPVRGEPANACDPNPTRSVFNLQDDGELRTGYGPPSFVFLRE